LANNVKAPRIKKAADMIDRNRVLGEGGEQYLLFFESDAEDIEQKLASENEVMNIPAS
jgi:hypothetical protein